MNIRFRFPLMTALVALSCASHAQVYHDIAPALGLVASGSSAWGEGCTFVDFDLDGFDDIVVPEYNGAPRFYRNQGGVGFEELETGITHEAGKSITFADIDSDGDLDFFLTRCGLPNKLYRNDSGAYFEVSDAGIYTENGGSFGATWGDLNRDGHLDLFVCNFSGNQFEPIPNRCYINAGDGTFTEQAAALGIQDPFHPTFQVIIVDYNRDGWQDIFVSNDKTFVPNVLFLNQEGNSFQDVSFPQNFGDYIFSMGIGLGDYNNNGLVDLYITNESDGNLLKSYNGFSFDDHATLTGTSINEFCWGTQWLDYDNDGWQDLAMCTDSNLSNNSYGHIHLMRNLQGNAFELQENEPMEGLIHPSYGMAIGDVENDGKLDILTYSHGDEGLQLWHHEGDAGNYVQLCLTPSIEHPVAIGAQVELLTASGVQTRWLLGGSGYMSQNTRTLHFGLNSETSVDLVKVTWPSGSVEVFDDVAVNAKTSLHAGTGLTSAISAASNVLCPGDSLLLTAPAGADSYAWDHGASGAEVYVSDAGTYQVEMTAGGAVTWTSEAFDVSAVTWGDWAVTATAPACYPDSLFVVALSGADAETLIWPYVEDQVMLPPGAYEVPITTAAGCDSVITFAFEAPLELLADITTTPPLCFGEASGTLELLASGGSEPLEVNLDPVADWNALPAGLYTATVVDALGCTASWEVTLDDPEALTLTLDTESLNTFGQGFIEALVAGGVPPFTFTWNGEENDETWLITAPQTVLCIVTDANGCTAEAEFIVTDVEDAAQLAAEVYPNPSSGWLTVTGMPNKRWELIDPQGRVALTHTLQSQQQGINATHLAPGIYLAVWHTTAGILSRRVVIQ